MGVSRKHTWGKPNKYTTNTSQALVVRDKHTADTSHALAVQDPAPATSSTKPYWTIDISTQKYFHDDSDGEVRTWVDGTKTRLKPAPPPAAPVPFWDTARKDWGWADQVNKCWVFNNWPKVPFDA